MSEKESSVSADTATTTTGSNLCKISRDDEMMMIVKNGLSQADASMMRDDYYFDLTVTIDVSKGDDDSSGDHQITPVVVRETRFVAKKMKPEQLANSLKKSCCCSTPTPPPGFTESYTIESKRTSNQRSLESAQAELLATTRGNQLNSIDNNYAAGMRTPKFTTLCSDYWQGIRVANLRRKRLRSKIMERQLVRVQQQASRSARRRLCFEDVPLLLETITPTPESKDL